MKLWKRLFGKPVTLSAEQRRRVDAWLAQADDANARLESSRFVVVDSESTGLDVRRDRPLSIGAVAIEHGRIQLDQFFMRVLRQERETTKANVVIHGISPTQRDQGVEPSDALLDFLEYAGKAPRIAYHAPFDRELLGNETKRRLGFKPQARWLDLAWLLPALFPEARLSRVALDLWLAYFRLQVPDRHRADVDALMTAELMLIAMKRAAKKGLDDFTSLADLAHAQAMLNHANGTGGI